VVRVPDVVGMSGSAGEQQLKQARLDYRVLGRRESEDTAVGAILSQDPAANEEVPPGSVVKVVLSEGPKSAVVPNVTRMSVAQAKKQLQLNGLEPGLVQDGYDDHVPASYVANSLPPPGSRVVRGTAVDLVVSKGPRPAMPPGPPLPALPKPERDEKLDFTVPADVGAGEAEVTVELVTGRGARQTLYVGRHRANEKIPTQTIAVREPVTARVLVNGQLRAEHRFEPDESAAPPPG
jgi:beta-lactam-binding protein with PASTA domain